MSDADVEGNLGQNVAGLLASFGIATADTRQSAEDLAAEHFARMNFDVEVVSLRFNVLIVACDPVTAHMLGYQKSEILEQLQGDLEGDVTDIRIRVRS